MILIAGRTGAEVVRDDKLGRVVLGVEFVGFVGEALVLRSPRFGSLDELEERVRFDLVRCGSRLTS